MAGTRVHLLVADPVPARRTGLARLLGGTGYRVTELSDRSRLPAEVRRGRFHGVLLDVSDSAGLEALAALRREAEDLLVIATTGAPRVESAVVALKHRAFDYLAHPLDAAALPGLLREALERHGVAVDLEQRLNREVGARVRARRHRLGLTLRQTARRTGLSVSLISQIELGKSAASLLSLYKLARALGVPASELLAES